MSAYNRNKSSVQHLSEPSKLTGYRQKNGLTAVWFESEESLYLPDEDSTEENFYRYAEGQVLANSSDQGTWFGVNHVENYPSQRRRQQYERLWRIDQGLDIDPSDRSLGIEAGHYADSNVVIESVSSHDLFAYSRADACIQQMELPQFVRDRVVYLITNQSLKRFNRFGGLEGAIVGYSIKALAEYREMSNVTQLKDSLWWSPIEEFAKHLGIIGATGRQFGQLINYIQDRHEGDA